jgi:hypothetical protein
LKKCSRCSSYSYCRNTWLPNHWKTLSCSHCDHFIRAKQLLQYSQKTVFSNFMRWRSLFRILS